MEQINIKIKDLNNEINNLKKISMKSNHGNFDKMISLHENHIKLQKIELEELEDLTKKLEEEI